LEGFQDFDIGQWQRSSGLMTYSSGRPRNLIRKQRTRTTRASIAVSLLAAVTTLAIAAPISLSQVQEKWATAPSLRPTTPRDPSLVPGRPEVYWGALMRDIASWEDVDETGPLDVPPLV
jgi:hypothetical protein